MTRHASRTSRTGRADHTPSLPPQQAALGTGWCLIGILLIVGAAVAAYAPTIKAGYIWDDDYYVTKNTHLRTLPGLAKIWFDIGATPQYYPAVHTTFWIEYHLWKLDPRGYHLNNVLLHALGAVMLWTVLRRLSVPGAWLAAAIFALHPVQVESVAWITERKNVLSGVFYFAALLAYDRFADLNNERPPDRMRWSWYALSAFLFCWALLSKTVTCSLPVVILLLLWWKRRRLGLRETLPLVPMVALGLALGLLTAWMEKHTVGARGLEWDFTLLERGLLAGRALWVYLGTLVYPAGLTFFYPKWEIDARLWWQYLYPLAALGAPVLLWHFRGRIGRAPLVAALFFGGTLLPALGFIDVYPMRYSYVADHFQYLASVGPITLFAALLVVALRLDAVRLAGVKVRSRSSPATVAVQALLPVGLLAVLGTFTWRQGLIYKDVETLWRDTLDKNPEAWMAYNNLGNVLKGRGNVDEALGHYRKALEIYPDCLRAHGNLAVTLLERGETAKAVVHWKEAIRLRPGHAESHFKLANTLRDLGRIDQAIDHYRQALGLDPELAPAHSELGLAWSRLGSIDKAIEHYNRALAIDPAYAKAHNNLAIALAMQGRLDRAVASFTEALRLNPDFVEALGGLGLALATQGRTEEALVHWRRAVEINPNNVRVWCLLGDYLSQLGRGQEAVAAYRQALRADPNCACGRSGLEQATQPRPDP